MNSGIKPNYSLSIGPLLYPWSTTQRTQYYQEVAESTEISRVYLGEIVCAKRQPISSKAQEHILNNLLHAGKEVVISTPILHNDAASHQLLLENIAIARHHQLAIEINDLAALKYAAGLDIILGSYLNIYNQASSAVLTRKGATLLCPPFESNRTILSDLAADTLPLEVLVYGRLPLSISSRCFLMRQLEGSREDCKLSCLKQSNGVVLSSAEEKLFLLNGMQVQSAKIYNLLAEIPELIALGIQKFRISPLDDFPLSEIIEQIQQSAGGGLSSETVQQSNTHRECFANGFYYGQQGHTLVAGNLNQ